MDTETSQIQLHQQLDVPESVITNLTKKSKRDKDVNQLLVALESFFTENSLTKTKDEIKRLNEQIAQKDIDYEQEIQDYLTKLKSSEEEKKKVIKESKKTEKSLKDKVKENESLKKDLAEARDQLNSMVEEKTKNQEQTSKFKEERENLISSLEAKVLELELIRSMSGNSEKDLSETRQELSKQSIIANELRSRVNTLENENLVLGQNLESFKEQTDFVQKELDEKVREFSNYRITKSTELSKLQRENEKLQSESIISNSKIESFTLQVNSLTNELKSNEEKNVELKKLLTEKENAFQKELDANSRLLALNKESMNISNERIQGLENEIEEIRSTLANERAEKSNLEQKYQQNDINLNEKIQSLEKELESYKSGQFIPENTEKLILSDSTKLVFSAHKTGKSFTEIYSEYIELEKKLNAERNNSKRLKEMVDALIKEIETSAPYFEKQRLDYDRIVKEAEVLSSQLNQALKSKENLSIDFKKATAKVDEYKRSSELLEKEADTLAIKVKALSMENKLLKKKASSTENQDENQLNENDTPQDHEEVIEFTEKDRKAIQEFATKIDQDERILKEQIESLENAFNEKKLELVEDLKLVIKKQEENLKVARSEIEILQKASQNVAVAPIQNTQAPPSYEHIQNIESEEQVKKLRNELDLLRIESHKNFSSLLKNNQKLKDELSGKVQDLIHLQAQFNFSESRYSLLNQSYGSIQNELKELRERNNTLETKLNEKDKMYIQILEESNDIKGQKDKNEIILSGIKRELELTKNNTERMELEIKTLNNDKSQINDRVIRLQLQLEEAFKRESIILTQKEGMITSLKEEIERVKNSLEESQQELSSQNIYFKRELKARQDRIDSLNSEIASIRAELSVSNSNLTHSKERIKSLEEDKVRLEALIQSSSSSDIITEELSKLRNDLSNAEKELLQSKTHQSELQSFAKASEEALKALSLTYEDYKKSSEEQMRINENSYKSQINKLTEIEERFNSLKDEHSKCIDKENEMISESKKIKDELNSELKTLKREVSHLQSLHQKKDKQIENLKTQLDLKTQNYESELTNHAEKIKSNHKTKKENEKLQKEVLELKTKVELAKAENDSIVFDLKSQIETNNLTIAGLEQRISHLTATNDTLLAQIEKAEAKVNTSFISVMSEEENLASSESNTVNYDLIKYFKKEKEVVLARIEVLGAENSRIKNERDNIRKELDHVRDLLNNDAKRGQDMNQISHLKQQLDEKILHLKQLNESNIHLRQDNDSLLKKKSKLEVKLIDTEKRSLSVDAKLQEVEKTIEEKDKQISDLKKDNEHWINRAQQILNSERVDPADHQKVKDELDAANKALSESKHSLEKLDLTVKELEEARNELNSVSVALKEAQISIEQYKLDIESLKANNKNELTDLKEKLNKQAKIMVAYKKKLQQVQANNAQQGGANNAQQGGTEASNKLQDNYNAAQQEISQLKQQVSSSSLEVSKLNQELDQVKKERAEIITRIKSGEDSNQNQGNNENLKSSLESKNKELETLNSTIRVLQEDKSVLESKVSSLANDSKLLYESMRLLVIPEDKKNETPNKISQIIKLYGKYKVMANSQPKDKAQGSTEVKGDSVKGKAQGTSEVREENDKQVQELEKEISSLKEELSLIRTSYDKLVIDNQLTKESNHKLAHDIASLQTVNGNQLEEINSLKVELSAKLAEINSLSQEIEKVTEEKRKVVSTLEMRGKALSTKHVNQSKKLQEEISELKNEVSRLNNELSGFKEPNSNPVAIPNPNMESNTFSEQLVNENINDNGSTNLHREQQSESDNVDKALEIRSSTILPSSTDEIINQNSDIQSTQTEDAQIRNKRKSPVPENIPAPESEVLHLNKKVKEAEVKDDSLGNDPQAVSENKNEALGSEPLDAPEQGTKPVNENEEGDLEVEGLSPLPENLDLGDLSDNEPNNEQ